MPIAHAPSPSCSPRLWQRLAPLLVCLGALLGCATATPDAQAQSSDRLGRVAWTEGQVTLARASGIGLDPTGQSGQTVLEVDTQRNGLREGLRNWPLTSGDRLRTGANAKVELGIGSTRLRLAPRSELELLQLDAGGVLLYLHQGSLAWRVDQPRDAAAIHIRSTMGGAGGLEQEVEPLGAGLFRIDLRPDGLVATAWRGQLRVRQPAASLVVNDGQAATVLAGQGWRLGRAQSDDFALWARGMDQLGAATVDLPGDLTGAEELADQGEWRDSSSYGRVWFPRRVAADWAPYQQGRWVWLSPWGWTWIDDAPWGFVTFQYGQWVQVGPRWGWRPGPRVVAPPHPGYGSPGYGAYDRRNPGYRYPSGYPNNYPSPPPAAPYPRYPYPGQPGVYPAPYPAPYPPQRDWREDPRRIDPPRPGWNSPWPAPDARVDHGYPIGRRINEAVQPVPPPRAPEENQRLRGPSRPAPGGPVAAPPAPITTAPPTPAPIQVAPPPPPPPPPMGGLGRAIERAVQAPAPPATQVVPSPQAGNPRERGRGDWPASAR